MRWREFLKPTWGKVIVTIILTVLAYLSLSCISLFLFGGSTDCSVNYFLLPFWFIFYFWVPIIKTGNFFKDSILPYLAILLQVIFNYLLICLIFGVFGRIVGKIKNKNK